MATSSNVLVTTFLLSLYCILTLSSAQPSGTQCPPVAGPSCACQPPGDDIGVLDLSPLSSSSGSARFTKIGPDSNNYVYSYNPCVAYTENNACPNVFICQTAEDGETSYPIANSGTEQIYYDEDQSTGSLSLYVYYTGPDNRQIRVYLTCDQSLTDGLETLTTTGDSKKILNYDFYLSSCHACPGGCINGPSSGGSIVGVIGLVIIFVAILGIVLYFIIGAVIMIVKYQATGSDIIPNKTFWFALPGLIKDGCLFIVSPCVKLARGRQGYQEAK